MKILCVIPSYFPAIQYRGPIISMHYLNKELVRKGIDLTVYTTNVGIEKKVRTGEKLEVDGVEVFYFPYIKLFEFLGETGWQFSPKLTLALKENLNNFDIIHIVAIWNYPTTSASYYARYYKKPYIITPHGALYPYTFGKKFFKKWIYYNLIIKRDIRGAKLVRFTTEDEAEKCNFF